MKKLTNQEMSQIFGGSTPGSCAFVTGLLIASMFTANIPAGALATYYLAVYCSES